MAGWLTRGKLDTKGYFNSYRSLQNLTDTPLNLIATVKNETTAPSRLIHLPNKFKDVLQCAENQSVYWTKSTLSF